MRPFHSFVVLCGLALLYVVAGKLGLLLAVFHPSATPVWPPTGISLALFLLMGYWVWPAIFLGALLVNVMTAGSIATSLGIATGNTLEGVLGAFLINRFAGGQKVFTQQRNTIKFVLLAAVLSTTVSATFGVTSLCLGGYAGWEQYSAIWKTWWLGDASGALIVTPAIVLWVSDHTFKWSRSQWLEIGLSFSLLSLFTLIVFHSGGAMTVTNYPLGLLAFSMLIWIALRLGPRETVTAILGCVAIAIWGTFQGSGPFAQGSPNETLLLLQAFMAVIAVTALAIAVGVAERKRAEQALDQLNQVLERRIQDRTNTLQATVEQLQECDRLKNAFVGIRSHELRTPLTSIKIFVENLLDGLAGPLTEKQQHYLSKIHLNVDQLARMLAELLNLSKNLASIEAGKMELRAADLSIDQLIAGRLEVFQPLARQKSITIEVISTACLPNVLADRDKLDEVLANLLENAIKFTPSGGRIQIGATILDDRYVKVQVSDTGCGIPEEHIPKIFDKFYRVQSVSTNQPGTGLGLAIAKALVELHGGTITVESVIGQGTHFCFTVPYKSGNIV